MKGNGQLLTGPVGMAATHGSCRYVGDGEETDRGERDLRSQFTIDKRATAIGEDRKVQ